MECAVADDFLTRINGVPQTPRQALLEAQERLRPKGRPVAPSPRVQMVYFIGHIAHAIKIGIAENVAWRHRDLQACSPIKIDVLATTPGGRSAELEYHRRFAAHRLHGEWFNPHPDILAEIDRLSLRIPTGMVGEV